MKDHFRKVPEITAIFWVIKILTTAFGEVLSDFLIFQIDKYLAVILGFIVFLIALYIQFYVKKYIPWVYWLAAAMVAVFGTMAADVVHIVLGISYLYSAIFFLVVLLIIFIIWKLSEKTLSIHSIYTRKREIFYWAVVIATFALGTATGDLTASTFRLGYLASGLLFLALISIPMVVYLKFKRNEVLNFWIAYILTRPLGASFADWIGKSKTSGGLGIGTGIVSLILLILISVCVVYISYSRTELEKEIK